MVDLTIISPTLNNPSFMENLRKNLKVLDASDVTYEYLVVSPYDIPINHESVCLLNRAKLGIYDAMNVGIGKAKGKLLYFIGDDDYILKDFPSFVEKVLLEQSDVGVANVKYTNSKDYKNLQSKIFLLFRNWNHQGILYDRKCFIKYVRSYNTSYVIQADHHANIIFAKKAKKVTRFKKNVSVFNTDGASGRVYDEAFYRDFPGLVLKFFGRTHYFLVMLKRFIRRGFTRW